MYGASSAIGVTYVTAWPAAGEAFGEAGGDEVAVAVVDDDPAAGRLLALEHDLLGGQHVRQRRVRAGDHVVRERR